MAVIGSVILARENTYAVPTHVVSDTAHAMTANFWIAVAVFAAGLLAGWALLPRRTQRVAESGDPGESGGSVPAVEPMATGWVDGVGRPLDVTAGR